MLPKEKISQSFERRRKRLNSVCQKYQNPLRIEHQSKKMKPLFDNLLKYVLRMER